MIETYLIAAAAAGVLALYIWGKINSVLADNQRVKAKAASALAESAKAAIDQLAKTAEARDAARQRAYVEQRTEQADIDTGKRDQFDKDGF
jgi:hypothetical protein